MTKISQEKLLHQSIIKGIQEKKAEEIISLDFAEVSNSICNYFIICQGSSERLVQAIVDSVEKSTFIEAKEKPINKAGYNNGQWVLLDYGNIIVHVFKDEYRELYNIEELWADAEITKYDSTHTSI